MKSVLEVNAIYFILLAEGFGLLLRVLLIWIVLASFRHRRKNRAVSELAARIRKRAVQRVGQTESFLQAVYRLEGDDLHRALGEIETNETEFFRLLVASLSQAKNAQIEMLDPAFDKLIESYKCLQPRDDSPQQAEYAAQVVNLSGENEQLKTELSQVKDRMSDMISEFGSMFGGGKNHELALEEVKAKVAAIQSENAVDIKLEAQK